jgi:hypothetical protein
VSLYAYRRSLHTTGHWRLPLNAPITLATRRGRFFLAHRTSRRSNRLGLSQARLCRTLCQTALRLLGIAGRQIKYVFTGYGKGPNKEDARQPDESGYEDRYCL